MKSKQSNSPIQDSIKTNQLFWIYILISIFSISYFTMGNTVSSYVSGIYTYLFMAFWGYLMHYISHSYNFTELYQQSTNFILKKCHNISIINKIIETILEITIDFHAIIHHDSSINRNPTNVIIEFIQNFLTQGGFLIILNNYISPTFIISLKSSVNPFKILLNNNILLLWALFYATVHNINYRIIESIEHENHHKDEKTNYGIDIVDIILNSKYNTKHKSNIPITIEDHNHAAINIVIITILILWPYLK
jgi:hypothetical protein